MASWNVMLEEDFWNRPAVWRRHDAHVPRKRSYFKNSLKISMRSSAFHSRSTFPLPLKSSHPHGNFPNTRRFYIFFFIVFSMMTNGHRIQIISQTWQAQWKPEAWAVMSKSHHLPTPRRDDSSSDSPWPMSFASLRACLCEYVWGPGRGLFSFHVLLGKQSLHVPVLLLQHPCLHPFPQSSLQTPEFPFSSSYTHHFSRPLRMSLDTVTSWLTAFSCGCKLLSGKWII